MESGLQQFSGKEDSLIYWIQERWAILQHRRAGRTKPWTDDPIFQTVYFCNVRREDDKVTRWLRDHWAQYADHPNYTLAMCMARIINYPPTLGALMFPGRWDANWFMRTLDSLASKGFRVWGNAYVFTTHGRPVSKATRACELLQAVNAAAPRLPLAGTLREAHEALQGLEGFGSFMAAQVVADLKNTPGHPLQKAEDWWTFSAHGPGSLRGLSWLFNGKVTASRYPAAMEVTRKYVDEHLVGVPRFCNQDLQNCLCEFDKYMRVKTGTGRSKRKYDGVHNNR
jgi:hypothetical protein